MAAEREGGKVALNLQVVLQSIMVASLLWFGSKVVTVSETVAVHEFRLTDQNGRLSRLETQK